MDIMDSQVLFPAYICKATHPGPAVSQTPLPCFRHEQTVECLSEDSEYEVSHKAYIYTRGTNFCC